MNRGVDPEFPDWASEPIAEPPEAAVEMPREAEAAPATVPDVVAAISHPVTPAPIVPTREQESVVPEAPALTPALVLGNIRLMTPVDPANPGGVGQGFPALPDSAGSSLFSPPSLIVDPLVDPVPPAPSPARDLALRPREEPAVAGPERAPAAVTPAPAAAVVALSVPAVELPAVDVPAVDVPAVEVPSVELSASLLDPAPVIPVSDQPTVIASGRAPAAELPSAAAPPAKTVPASSAVVTGVLPAAKPSRFSAAASRSFISPKTVIYERPDDVAALKEGRPPAALASPADLGNQTVNLDRPAELAALQVSVAPAATPAPSAREVPAARAEIPAPAAATQIRPVVESFRSSPAFAPPTLMVDPGAAAPIRPKERTLPEPPAWAGGGSNTHPRAGTGGQAVSRFSRVHPAQGARPSSAPKPTRAADDARHDWGRQAIPNDDSGEQAPPARPASRKPDKASGRARRIYRQPHPWLKAMVVFLLLIGVGALAVARLVPAEQKASFAADVRGILQRAAARAASRLDSLRGRRERPVLAPAVGLARVEAGDGSPAAAPDSPAAAARARVARGKQTTVYLASQPAGANVFGPDGSLVGTTPLTYTLPLRSTEKVTFTAEGFRAVTRIIKGDRKPGAVVVKLVPSRRLHGPSSAKAAPDRRTREVLR